MYLWVPSTVFSVLHVFTYSQIALVVKNPFANAGDTGNLGCITRLGRPSGGGHGNPLQYSCLGESHGQRSLVGYSPGGCKELDMTEQLSMHTHTPY